MLYPTPQHLRGILELHLRQSNGHQIQGAIRCPCGSYTHALLYVGNRTERNGQPRLELIEVQGHYLIAIAAKCTACAQEHLLFDDRFHGWNGYVCGSEEEREMPRPPWLEWHCHHCDAAPQKLTLTLQGEDTPTLIPEADGLLNRANWHEGFSNLTLDLTCPACRKPPTEILSLETM
jgi:hypothetical protein